MRTPLRRSLSVTAAAALALLTASCASPASSADPTPEPGEAAAAYPLIIDNCGTEVTFESAPERVVTIKSSTTELLVALGLGDRIIGQAYPDDELPEEIGGQQTPSIDIPVISERVPGQEAVLDLEPDLVFAGWESNFAQDAVGDRETLEALGVHTYVAPSACKGSGYQPEMLSFDDVFAHIEEIGAIFGVPDAATTLIEQQQAVLDRVTPASEGVSALWWSSGSDAPYVGGGIGAPQMIMEAAGLDNIADDVDDTWGSYNWESVIEANPDVIVLVESDWGTAEKKIGVITSNPATAQLDAVVDNRFIVVPFAATEAGVRNADAVASITTQLEELGL